MEFCRRKHTLLASIMHFLTVSRWGTKAFFVLGRPKVSPAGGKIVADLDSLAVRRFCKTVELMAALYDGEGLLVANVGRVDALKIDIGRLRMLLDDVASGQREPMSLPITAAAWVMFSALVDPLRQCYPLSQLTHSHMFGRLLSGHGYVEKRTLLEMHHPLLDSPAAMQGS
jgi:hypothetical protein